MSLDEFAFQPRRVEKPWGYELIWAHSERYVGKELFVREGQALSLQFHEVKDETIYVQQGRIEFQIGPRDGELASEVVGPGARSGSFPAPSTGCARSRTRSCSRCRRPTSTTSSGWRTATAGRGRP